MKTIDNEKLQQDLKETASNKQYDNIVDFEDVYAGANIDEYDLDYCAKNYLDAAEDICEWKVYEEYKGNPIKVFFKKAIRKILSFILIPLDEKQSRFNSYILTYLKIKEKEDNEKGDKPSNIMNNISPIFDNHEKQINELESKILYLEKKLEELENNK